VHLVGYLKRTTSLPFFVTVVEVVAHAVGTQG